MSSNSDHDTKQPGSPRPSVNDDARPTPSDGSSPGEAPGTGSQNREIHPGDQLPTGGTQDASVHCDRTPPRVACGNDLWVVPQPGTTQGDDELNSTSPANGVPDTTPDGGGNREVPQHRVRGIPGRGPHASPFSRWLYSRRGNERWKAGSPAEPPVIPNRWWRINLQRMKDPCCQSNDPSTWGQTGHLILCLACETLGTPNREDQCVEHPSILTHSEAYKTAFERITWTCTELTQGQGKLDYRFYQGKPPGDHLTFPDIRAVGAGMPALDQGEWAIPLRVLLLPLEFIGNLRIFTRHVACGSPYSCGPPPMAMCPAWVCDVEGTLGTRLNCGENCPGQHLEVTQGIRSLLFDRYQASTYLDAEQNLQVMFWIPGSGGGYPVKAPYESLVIDTESMPLGQWSIKLDSLPRIVERLDRAFRDSAETLAVLSHMRTVIQARKESQWEETFRTACTHLSGFISPLDSPNTPTEGPEPGKGDTSTPSQVVPGEGGLTPGNPPRPREDPEGGPSLPPEARKDKKVFPWKFPFEHWLTGDNLARHLGPQCTKSTLGEPIPPGDTRWLTLREPPPPRGPELGTQPSSQKPQGPVECEPEGPTKGTLAILPKVARDSVNRTEEAVEAPFASTPLRDKTPPLGDLEMSVIKTGPRDPKGQPQE